MPDDASQTKPTAPATDPQEIPVTSPAPTADGGGVEDYEPLTPELVEEEAIRGDFVLKWAVVLLALLLGSTRIGESSTLVRIKSGQYIAAHGFWPPSHDVFSYTAQDRPWHNLAWGFDLLAAGLHALGSFEALSAVKALLLAVTFGLLVGISRPNMPTWWGSICAAAALLACHTRVPFLPHLVTLLGSALVLLTLHRAGEEEARPKALWWLVPVVWLWCNLDERAYLGPFLMLLYFAGDWLAARLGGRTSLAPVMRSKLMQVALASAAVTVIHPMTFRSLLGAAHVYGSVYPAFRDYIVKAGGGKVPSGQSLYFSLFDGAFWEDLNLAGWSALAVLAAALVLFLANFSRIAWSQLAIWLGATLLALVCVYELPFAAVVSAVAAALNGQDWYAVNCRQTYSVATRELLFSRGGRAVTVLVLAGIGFFGGTGRLRDPAQPRTGFGLDRTVASNITDMRRWLVGVDSGLPGSTGEAAGEPRSFDDRPFNFNLGLGDYLIWIGQKPFVDTRLPLYHDPDEAQNLLDLHTKLRAALRKPPVEEREEASQPGRLRPARRAAERSSSRRRFWQEQFDKYKLTHVVLRLSAGAGRARVDDYASLGEMLGSENDDWVLTDLGATCAVLYRQDLADPRLAKYLAEHAFDVKKLAFAREAQLFAPRIEWVRPPSFYEKYFWSKKREIPLEIQQAMHFAGLAALPDTPIGDLPALPPSLAESRVALAYLAIREAQLGLQLEPNSVMGYLVLGQAYDTLRAYETLEARNPARNPFSGVRYLQSITALNQALVADAENQGAHLQLANMYQQAGRIDLEYRHLQALLTLWQSAPETDFSQLLSIQRRVDELKKSIESVREDLEQISQSRGSLLDRVSYLVQQRGCLLMALELLDREAEARTGNLPAEQLRIFLQIESGRVQEAYENAERFAVPAQRSGLPNWHDAVAIANLPNANYARAAELWGMAAEEASKNLLTSLVQGLAPHPVGSSWPLSTTQVAADYFFRRPDIIAESRLNTALLYLDQGQLTLAQGALEGVILANPETVHRPLVAYYLRELTGKEEPIEPFPPSQSIPMEFAPEEP